MASAFRLRVMVSVLAGLLLAILTIPALAGERVALVIGNAQYAHARRLANPLNDAADIGTALARLGFAVTKLENTDYAVLRQGLQAFSLAASASEVAVVFYAGHGIEVDQRNFLVPVDARLASDQDVEFETVPLELVMRSVSRASGLRLVILDACRENPFAVSMQRSGATRAIGRGLARVEPAGETLVAYAAKEGTTADDGEGRNSPYSTALLRYLEEPGLELNLLFRKVRDAVLASTGGRQEPYTYGSLSSQGVYLTARLEPDPRPSTVLPPSGDRPSSDRLTAEQLAAERLFWESVKDSEDAADIQAYLDKYPGGEYEALARNRLRRLRGSGPAADSAAVPPQAPLPAVPSLESVEAALGLERSERRLIQLGLAAEGFDPGPTDGLFGRGTRGSIGRWQGSRRGESTGYLDAESARLLLASGRKRESQEQARRDAEARARQQAAAEAERQRRERDAQERASADDAAYAQAKSLGTVAAYGKYLRTYPSGRHAQEARRLRAEAQAQAEASSARKRRKTLLRDATDNLSNAIAEAENLFKGKFPSSAADAFVDVARVQAQIGNVRDAEKSFSRALAAVQRMGTGCCGKFFALTDIAMAQAEAGSVRDAQKSISEALAAAQRLGDEDIGLRSRLFSRIAVVQILAGSLRDAEKSFSKAISDAQGAFHASTRASAFAAIAIAQAEVGNIRAAENSISKAVSHAQKADDRYSTRTAFVKIAIAQARLGNVRDALAIAQRIDADEFIWGRQAIVEIARAQAEAGNVRDAWATVRRLKVYGGYRAEAFAYIASAQARAGNFRDALATVQRIPTDDKRWRAHAFAHIAAAQQAAGEALQAN